MKKLKVAFIAGFMEGFSEEKLKLFSIYQEKLKKLAVEMDFDLINYRDIITELPQAIAVRDDMDEKGIDFALILHPSYIMGTLIYEILKTRANIGLWAVEELRDEGPMPLASFVSMEQNASMAIHNFLGKPRKFKWFFGDIEGKYFKNRFEITIKVLSAIKKLHNSRVAQIGKLVDGHINHMSNEREIYKNLGVDVLRDYEIEDIIKMGDEIPEKAVNQEMENIKSCEISRVSRDKVIDSIRMYLAVRKICVKEDYQAVAFSC